jgi:hypothetical protein
MFFPSHGANATRRRRAQAGFSELRAAGLTIRTSNFELRTHNAIEFCRHDNVICRRNPAVETPEEQI